jgi:UDPglucose--hexose-1-phosphate uridylyltransferase
LKITSGGFHEIVITREHNKPMAKLSKERIKEVLTCYKERYLELKKYDFNMYILVFHNHGKEAGASQKHPHSQILTSPLIDKELIFFRNQRNIFKIINIVCNARLMK